MDPPRPAALNMKAFVQSRSYVADALGFRVAASDLPVGPAPVAAVAPVAVAAPVAAAPIAAGPVHVAALPAPVSDTYEVAAAKAQHYAAHAEARARNGDGLLLAGAPIAAPVAVAAAPVAVAAPVVAGAGLQSQYHAQDELGQYSYGYAGGLSAKNEAKTADGITRGSYSYVDAHGLVQSRSYVSDPINGFRVAASDLPVGPAPVAAAAPVAIAAPVAAAPIAVPAPIAAPIAAPVAAPIAVAAPAAPAYVSDDTVVVGGVADTPEVAAAKAAHYAAHHEAHARLAHAY
ncbi:hypothetical protein FOCC_FOCC001086 [Frankliniella occidentalis]|nr:hypothetical protein FOCC_FOCC001086 [Frankliniella occidentalis]